MIAAALFDMDGLLIDSEPLWQQAEMKVFAELGVNLTAADCASTMGFRIDEVVQHWYSLRPWQAASQAEVQERILDAVIELICAKGERKPGVDAVLSRCQAHSLRIGLASSSYQRVIEAVMRALRLEDYFEVRHSAEFEQRGKPAPDVYLTAAGMLGVKPADCLVFEDSLAGVRAAKAAGMYCVAVPDADAPKDLLEQEADVTISSLVEFSEELFQQIDKGSAYN